MIDYQSHQTWQSFIFQHHGNLALEPSVGSGSSMTSSFPSSLDPSNVVCHFLCLHISYN